MSRRRVAAIVAAVLVFAVIAGWGCAGRWESLRFSAPQAFSAAALLYTALAPVHPDTGERTRVTGVLLWSTLPAVVVQQVVYVLDGQRGDLVVVIGWYVLILGFGTGARGPALLRRTLRRLADRAVLGDGSGSDVATAADDLVRSGRRWSVVGSVVVAGVLIGTWPRAAEFAARWNTWEIGPAVADQVWVVVAGGVVGGLLGRMIGHGRLARVLTRRGVRLRLVAGHPDRAAGMRPVGAFYLYQSWVAALPALFLALWILVVVFGGAEPEIGRYRPFLSQYSALLVVVIAFEVLVFVGPLFAVHRMMAAHKEDVLLAEADQLSPGIEATHARLINAEDPAERESAQQRFEHLSRYRDQLEKTPTWPIDPSIRRRFTLRNLGFLVPVATQLLQDPVGDLITRATTGAGP